MALAKDALWETGHDESVEVNQRALIDKVLARYSGEFTVFRELLQNSSDAGSKTVEIHFETEAYLERKKQASLNPDGEIPVDNSWKVPDFKTTLIHQWMFKNDGMIFREEDWSRLKKIAEGNPDEEKIGAFGVGFYSLFSVTEEPFVTSGGQWMGFYWKDKKDQLFARRGTMPVDMERPDPWTTFTMTLREPAPAPTVFDFVRFLTSSITFVANLTQVSVWFDGKRLARISRERGAPKPLTLRPNLKRESSKGIMCVVGVEVMPLYIKAEAMRCIYVAGTTKPRKSEIIKETAKVTTAVTSGFFSSLFSSFTSAPQRTTPALPAPTLAESKEAVEAKEAEEQKRLMEVLETSVVLTIFAADISVSLDDRMRKELLRATKKNPPSKMKLELIYTGKDEYDASKKEDDKQPQATGSILQGLRADIDGTGLARVFIGHTTGQTTGLGGHMAARFIPTVERESIDLVDRNVRVWNEQLLDMGGYLARTAYEVELDNIRNLWNGAKGPTGAPDVELQSWLRGRALHALKFFTFHPSTPASQVSTLLEEAFFSCAVTRGFSFLGATTSPAPFPILSTTGVMSASDVRIPSETFTVFLKQLPVLPDEILSGARKMVDSLRERGMLHDINFSDVIRELSSRPLLETELIACLKWWITVYKESGNDPQLQNVRTQLLNAAILVMGTPGGADEKLVPMSSIKTFLNMRGIGAFIPTDAPLPDHLLPLSISRHLDPGAITSALLWKELSVLQWLQHLVDSTVASADPTHDLTQSATFAERMLNVLARAWPSLSKSVQEEVVALLFQKACIPTSMGMRKPEEAYFQTAHVFSDLPIVALPSDNTVKGVLEKVLLALGVRKHVDLQIVFNRMIKTGDWTTSELVKYLVAVQSTLSDEEKNRLRMTAAFPTESVSNASSPEKVKVVRHKASDLYEPLDTFRELGLPVLDWGTGLKWRKNSDEAKFMYDLGLRRFPPLDVLLNLAAGSDANVRPVALKYLLDNMTARYTDYDPSKYANLAYIPAMKVNKPLLGKPNEVFTNPVWASLGFAVAHPSLRPDDLAKLGIKEHPPTASLVLLLQNTPPENEQVAKQWFGIMASRVSDFSAYELRVLSELPFVPVENSSSGHKEKGSSTVRLLPPTKCYFKGDANIQVHSKFFVFVDFGQGNILLTACGTKREPSVEEVARILLDNPRRFFELCEGRDNYLFELRNIAINRRSISTGMLARLKRSPAFLASRRVRRGKTESKLKSIIGDLEDEDDWDFAYDLMRPDTIVVADDTNAYQHFGDSIFTAPQEDLLEEFYIELGSRRLSSLVKENYKTSSEIKGANLSAQIRSLILERLPLFLHEHSHTKTRVSCSWLNDNSNFLVRTFGKITVVKSLNFGQASLTKNQDASAVATRDGRGPIQLWLSGSDSIDMYEVSTSMCRLLFDSPKPSDALLFMTILSTDLRALRRRGYNVDRILRKQKAEREAAEDAAREAAKQMSLISHPGSVASPADTTAHRGADMDSGHAGTELLPDKEAHHQAGIRGSLDNWKRKFTGKNDLPPIPGTLPAPPTQPRPASPSPSGTSSTPLLSPNTSTTQGASPSPHVPASRPRTPQPGVTPLSNIASNINMAIKSCRGEHGKVIQNKEHMQLVKESLNEGYCDVAGRAGDLVLLGKMGEIKIFATHDVLQPASLLTTKRDPLARFIHIIHALRKVYDLPETSLHIFYDVSGDLIAFNRNASLFLNLRFFESWHDADVRNGVLSKAYISWYFTLAHEIAHNLVQPHNSEHEFWFSSICEAYLPTFSKLLGATS